MIVGERVSYEVAGRAMRQAITRAGQAKALSQGDWQNLCAVLAMTTTYSRLSDHVRQGELADVAGTSTKTTQRSLERLSAAKVIFAVSGRGAGVKTLVGVPPEGEKADAYLSTLLDEKVDNPTPEKVDRTAREKVDTHARARKDLREGKTSETEDHREEYVLAAHVLRVFNETAETNFPDGDWVPLIAKRIREFPTLTLDDHAAVIEHVLADDDPWWEGDTDPRLVYGNGAVFEHALHAAARPPDPNRKMTNEELRRYFAQRRDATETIDGEAVEAEDDDAEATSNG